MTDVPGAGHERVRDVVRPLRARLVRPDRAAEKVFPMLDALPASERTSQPDPRTGPSRAVTPEGYDEADPGLFVYRLRRGDDDHVGLVADVRVQAFVDGLVRGHEEVQRERVAALVDHFSSAAVRSELVALMHRAGPVTEKVLAGCADTDPVLRFVGPEGWEQTVWRVPDSERAEVLHELSNTVHYVADGHHRVAASLSVWRAQGEPTEAGIMCVIYPFDGLHLLAFHRRAVGPLSSGQLLDLLGGAFEVTELAGPDESTGAFAVYVDGRWYDAVFTGERAAGAAGLDVTLLDEHVLQPLVEDGTAGVEIASALTPISDLERACDVDGGALFALRPPALERLIEVADRGEVMPPKTTYFDPKPFAGIFLA